MNTNQSSSAAKQRLNQTPNIDFKPALVAAGIDQSILDSKGHPCPYCGGTDRWNYGGSDKHGGTNYCRQCGKHDGLDLIQQAVGLDFSEAVKFAAGQLGIVPPEMDGQPLFTPIKTLPEYLAAEPKLAQSTRAHTYYKSKGINPVEGVRVSSDGATLFVPVHRGLGGELISAQRIYWDKRKNKHLKYMLSGSSVKGGSFRVGGIQEGKPILLAESLATTATVYQASSRPTISTFGCGGMPAVGALVRLEHPTSPLIFFGDIDPQGRAKAIQAAQECGGYVCFPSFTNGAPKDTADFNDLHQAEGIDVVRDQVERAVSLALLGDSEVDHEDMPPLMDDAAPLSAYEDMLPLDDDDDAPTEKVDSGVDTDNVPPLDDDPADDVPPLDNLVGDAEIISAALEFAPDNTEAILSPLVINALSRLKESNINEYMVLRLKYLLPWKIATRVEREIAIFRGEERSSRRAVKALEAKAIATDARANKEVRAALRIQERAEKADQKRAVAEAKEAAYAERVAMMAEIKANLPAGLKSLTDINGRVEKDSIASKMLPAYFIGKLAIDPESKLWMIYRSTDQGGGWWESSATPQGMIGDALDLATEPVGYPNIYRLGVQSTLMEGRRLDSMPPPNLRIIPFRNGLLDTRNGLLTPATPQTAQRYMLPYDYDPAAKSDIVRAWLLELAGGRDDVRQFLRAWLAALIHGRCDLQKYLHLLGAAGSGKGTFIRLATALVGQENAVVTTMDLLESNRFEMPAIVAARLVAITDGKRRVSGVNNFLALTGGDKVRVEIKHKAEQGAQAFSGMMLVASNESLISGNTSGALARRMMTVACDQVVSEGKKIEWQRQGGEEAVLHAEMSGLVNWVLGLSQEVISHALRYPPEPIKHQNKEAQEADNPIIEWINDYLIEEAYGQVQVGNAELIRPLGEAAYYKDYIHHLYPSFRQFCDRAGRGGISRQGFTGALVAALKSRGWKVEGKKTNRGRFVTGVRLVDVCLLGVDADND